MKDFRHDNINMFIGACVDPPNFILLTEYCAKGSLQVSNILILPFQDLGVHHIGLVPKPEGRMILVSCISINCSIGYMHVLKIIGSKCYLRSVLKAVCRLQTCLYCLFRILPFQDLRDHPISLAPKLEGS